MLQRQLKQQRGFSLTSMMVAMGVGSIVAVGSLQVISALNQTQNTQNDNQVRDTIVQQIRTQIKRRPVINASALVTSETGNIQLSNCLQIVGADCTILDPAAQLPIQLLRPVGGGTDFIAGTPTRPKYYSATGQSCPAGTAIGSTTCRPAWQADAYFWAGCQAGQSSCKEARTIYLRFQVRPLSSATWTQMPKAVPPDPEFDLYKSSSAYTFRIQAGLISGESCPLGAVQTGVKPDGKPNCVCPSGMIQTGTDANGNPLCTAVAQRCPLGQQMMGYDINGAPVCQLIVPLTTRPTCRPNVPRTCGTDEWIQEVFMNSGTWTLRVRSRGSSISSSNISYSQPRFRCCRFP